MNLSLVVEVVDRLFSNRHLEILELRGIFMIPIKDSYPFKYVISGVRTKQTLCASFSQ